MQHRRAGNQAEQANPIYLRTTAVEYVLSCSKYCHGERYHPHCQEVFPPRPTPHDTQIHNNRAVSLRQLYIVILSTWSPILPPCWGSYSPTRGQRNTPKRLLIQPIGQITLHDVLILLKIFSRSLDTWTWYTQVVVLFLLSTYYIVLYCYVIIVRSTDPTPANIILDHHADHAIMRSYAPYPATCHHELLLMMYSY